MKEIERHLMEYLVLLVGLLLFSILFWYFSYNRSIQIAITGLASISYVLWGIIHHVVEGRLNRQVAMEYILVGTLVFLLLLTVLTI